MKTIVISLIAVILFVSGAILLLSGGDKAGTTAQSNVSIADGKQIIEINAKGGYSPRQTVAKANMPTIIKVTTNGTYDCSSVLIIQNTQERTFLPATGETQIAIPQQSAGSVVKGVCAMGMYSFAVQFN